MSLCIFSRNAACYEVDVCLYINICAAGYAGSCVQHKLSLDGNISFQWLVWVSMALQCLSFTRNVMCVDVLRVGT